MSTSPSGWVGVDLDGTLAVYDGWHGPEHIGAPISRMVDRIRVWLSTGTEVRIFTARVCSSQPPDQLAVAKHAIAQWCTAVFGRPLPVTAEKDWSMIQLWDDRAVSVEANTGHITTQPI